jgi:hypothetical protein
MIFYASCCEFMLGLSEGLSHFLWVLLLLSFFIRAIKLRCLGGYCTRLNLKGCI